jgi:hypothetical protein
MRITVEIPDELVSKLYPDEWQVMTIPEDRQSDLCCPVCDGALNYVAPIGAQPHAVICSAAEGCGFHAASANGLRLLSMFHKPNRDQAKEAIASVEDPDKKH